MLLHCCRGRNDAGVPVIVTPRVAVSQAVARHGADARPAPAGRVHLACARLGVARRVVRDQPVDQLPVAAQPAPSPGSRPPVPAPAVSKREFGAPGRRCGQRRRGVTAGATRRSQRGRRRGSRLAVVAGLHTTAARPQTRHGHRAGVDSQRWRAQLHDIDRTCRDASRAPRRRAPARGRGPRNGRLSKESHIDVDDHPRAA